MLYACFCLNHFLLIIRKLDKIVILTFWICTALLFYYIASSGFKDPPRDWGSLMVAGGGWISLMVMFIIAMIISTVFGIPMENIVGFRATD